jgi:putative Mg2+ transporter-C (MgtC) family protein
MGQRAAGLRTNTLVCFGAAAFVDLGLRVAPGTTQVIAYVVSGVGFLGAGAILKDGGSVRGLNTTATLWCSAAVGACAGAGESVDAVFVSVLLIGASTWYCVHSLAILIGVPLRYWIRIRFTA